MEVQARRTRSLSCSSRVCAVIGFSGWFLQLWGTNMRSWQLPLWENGGDPSSVIPQARLGADATVALRITLSSVVQGAAEILVYGTAVRLD